MPKPPLHARWLALGMVRALRTQIRPLAKPDNAAWTESWVAGQLNVRAADVRFWLDAYEESSVEQNGVVGLGKRNGGVVAQGKLVAEWRELGGRAEDVLPSVGDWVPSWAAAAESASESASSSGSSTTLISSADASSFPPSSSSTTPTPAPSPSDPSAPSPSSPSSPSAPSDPSPSPTLISSPSSPSPKLTVYKPSKLERRRRATLQDHELHPSLRWQAVGMQRALESHLPLVARMEGFDYVISDVLGVRRKTVKDWVTQYYETGTVDPDVVSAIPEGREKPLVERRRGFYEV